MPTQELHTITKETQKTVLKAICDNPTLPVDELTVFLKNKFPGITQEEILQVIYSISPNKNWHRATQEDIQKEILDYVWTLETQILLLLPTKQKETTITEFNQLRLEHKQSRVTKDLVRHLQSNLMVESKNLSRFRKFKSDLAFLTDLDPNIQTSWLVRIVMVTIEPANIGNQQEFSVVLINEIKEKYPTISEKVSKNLQRMCERFIEKYFPKNLSEPKLKEFLSVYKSTFTRYEKFTEGEELYQSALKEQNKLILNITEELKEVQEIIIESHEGGFLSKLFTGKVKNKEGVVQKINEVISLVNEINELNDKTNKTINDKSLFVQKIQSDYENMVLVKNQLEHDLYNLNDKFKSLEEKTSGSEKDLQDKISSLEQSHERIKQLQQKVDEIPQLESKINMLREELNTAKTIVISLYSRIIKIKDDLHKLNPDNLKVNKTNGSQINNQVIHKVQQDENTGHTVITTEAT